MLSVLKELEKKLLQSQIRKSKSELNILLADDFIEFGSSGKIYNKKQVIRTLKDEPAIKITASNFKMIPLAKGYFLLTYKSTKEASGEKTISLRSSVWKKNRTGYRIIFHQGTHCVKP